MNVDMKWENENKNRSCRPGPRRTDVDGRWQNGQIAQNFRMQRTISLACGRSSRSTHHLIRSICLRLCVGTPTATSIRHALHSRGVRERGWICNIFIRHNESSEKGVYEWSRYIFLVNLMRIFALHFYGMRSVIFFCYAVAFFFIKCSATACFSLMKFVESSYFATLEDEHL